MKESSPIRKIITAGVTALTLSACDQKPTITEGTVYKKEHVKAQFFSGGAGYGQSEGSIYEERDIEAIGSQPIHQENGLKARGLGLTIEYWKVSFVQCPTPEQRTIKRLEKECKINSAEVSQNIFNRNQVGQFYRTSK